MASPPSRSPARKPIRSLTISTVRKVPWTRVLLEGAVIVLSILLAFGIQAWWDDLSEAREETRLLRAVLEEARANQTMLEEEEAYQRAGLQHSRRILRLAGSDPANLSPELTDTLIADFSWWSSSDWATGAVESLTAGGKLSEITNGDVRRRLAALPRTVGQLQVAQRQEYEFFVDVFMPLMREQGSLPQISNAITLRPGSSRSYEASHFELGAGRTDHRALLLSARFQNAVVQKAWIQTDVLNAFRGFAETLDDLIGAVEEELGLVPGSP